jgi:hypothetical protein
MYGIGDLSDIYGALGHDSCIGDAFLKWHRSNYDMFWGTVMLGDPTLKVIDSTARYSHHFPKAENGNSPVAQYQAAKPLDWTQYIVDTSDFVNGRPVIGQSQGHIRLMFDTGRNVRCQNYFTSLYGTSFTQPESIAYDPYYNLFSSVCTDALGRFWVVWQSFRDYDQNYYEHFQIFSCYYYDSVWQSNAERVGPLAGYHDEQPSIASGADTTVWCAFKSWRNGEADIYVSSNHNANGWATPVRLTTDSLDQIDPCVAVDQENHPWVFWQSQANGNWHIQGRMYDGGSWQPIFDLDTTGTNGPPRAAVDGSNQVWVIWHKWEAGHNHIYYACRNDSSWGPVTALTSGSTDDFLPDITTDHQGKIWACWQSGQTGAWSIYTSHYDGTWTTPDAATTDNSNNYDPTIGTDASGNIWTAWASDRRGYWDIYAARAPSTGTTYPIVRAGASASPYAVGPNPFSRRVSFAGPSRFAVDIYAVDGRKVAQLAATSGAATWTPGLLPHGIYLARIRSGNARSTVKLTYAE